MRETHRLCEHHTPDRLQYIAAHEDAERRHARGEVQTQCPVCKIWLWPHEQGVPPVQTAPRTSTPLSEAVARLKAMSDVDLVTEFGNVSFDCGEFTESYEDEDGRRVRYDDVSARTDALRDELLRRLDAVAEGREKIAEVLPMLERANSDLMWIESGHFDSVEEVVSEISDAASHVSDAVFTLKQAFPPPPAPTEPG